MLKTLQNAYGSPVDIEFTANFLDEREYRINLLQCLILVLTADAVIYLIDTPSKQDRLKIFKLTPRPILIRQVKGKAQRRAALFDLQLLRRLSD